MSAAVCGSKRSFFEDLPPSPPVSSKRLRCSSSPIRLSLPSLIDHLQSLFPHMEDQIIERALQECGNDLDAAIKSLHGLCLGSADENSVVAPNSDAAVETGVFEGNGDASASGNQAAENNLPADGPEWIDLFVREMSCATSVDDARARAAKLLEVLEKSISSNVSSGAMTDLQRENLMLKYQVEVLTKERNCFKSAFRIQLERLSDYEDKDRELQQLKQLVSQYQEQIRTLEIAVKRLKVWSNKADMEFAVEVEILARVRHKNLLSLRGYCAEGQERLIVYDYMPNLSLLSHLHGQHSTESLLDWNRRMNIAIGSAEGILYLHVQATPHIIHRDVKASNVLLDSDFQARVADFGFAKLIPDGATHVTTRVKGTLGYLAPEYAMLGKANESCDVYSFGILLLELASGKKPLEKLSSSVKRSINDWALPLACEKKFSELADPRLNGDYSEEELKRVVLVALICAQSQPEKRPTMLEVVELLKGESKEKVSQLENNELFKNPLAVGNNNDEISAAEGSSDFISEEKESKHENADS